MSTKVCTAVMLCTRKQHRKIVERGMGVFNGIYKNSLLFVNVPIDKSIFKLQLDKAVNLQALAKGGGEQATIRRDVEVGALFDMLNDILKPYVNMLFKSDRKNILDSGFPASKDPSPRGIPDSPIIKDIVDGVFLHSAKIILEKTTNPLSRIKESFNYIVQMSENGIEGDYKIVLIISNQYKLIIPDLTRGKEVFLRVAKYNSRGQSGWSEPRGFIPQ